jgi:AraC-like DNA-binding protein
MQVALLFSNNQKKGITMSENTWETLAVEAKFCPHALARLCNVSLRTLQRRFDKTYGTPVGHWMRNLRLAQAYARIAVGESVKSVAYDLHFKQLSHFSRVFKETYGVPPTMVSPGSTRRTTTPITAANPLPTPADGSPGPLLRVETAIQPQAIETHTT